jgi:hypothetical protein
VAVQHAAWVGTASLFNTDLSLVARASFRARPILVLGSAHVYSPDHPPTIPSTERGAHTPQEEPEVDTTGVWLAVQQVEASQPASQPASQRRHAGSMRRHAGSIRHTRHHYCV